MHTSYTLTHHTLTSSLCLKPSLDTTQYPPSQASNLFPLLNLSCIWFWVGPVFIWTGLGIHVTLMVASEMQPCRWLVMSMQNLRSGRQRACRAKLRVVEYRVFTFFSSVTRCSRGLNGWCGQEPISMRLGIVFLLSLSSSLHHLHIITILLIMYTHLNHSFVLNCTLQ